MIRNAFRRWLDSAPPASGVAEAVHSPAALGATQQPPAPAAKVTALPLRDDAAWIAAALVKFGYSEIEGKSGYRVFHKPWSAFEYRFLARDGRLLGGAKRNPRMATEADPRTVDYFRLKGYELLSAEGAA